ncbi:hypothetical protein LBMAG53_30230 [Planctomycetota bacterium]|nr:hypothetical protein LBMAG53_30230 [Planctomycetota bacterium]
MKKTAKSALRDTSPDDLRKQIDELRGGLLKARFATRLEGKRQGMGQRNARRQIARIETILTEKSKAAK